MYVPIIGPADLTTVIRQEKLDSITRDDTTIIDRAITAGIQEVILYCTRYDTLKMFGDAENDIPASFENEFLKVLAKDIICWRLVKLANVAIDLELLRTGYEDAIKTLRLIQKGEVEPKWPLVDNSTVDTTNSPVAVNSRPKRSNNW